MTISASGGLKLLHVLLSNLCIIAGHRETLKRSSNSYAKIPSSLPRQIVKKKKVVWYCKYSWTTSKPRWYAQTGFQNHQSKYLYLNIIKRNIEHWIKNNELATIIVHYYEASYLSCWTVVVVEPKRELQRPYQWCFLQQLLCLHRKQLASWCNQDRNAPTLFFQVYSLSAFPPTHNFNQNVYIFNLKHGHAVQKFHAHAEAKGRNSSVTALRSFIKPMKSLLRKEKEVYILLSRCCCLCLHAI